MAFLHGKNAKILWDAENNSTTLTHGQSWSAEATQDTAEITEFGSSWRTFLGGFNDWTATVECLLPQAGAEITYDVGDPNGLGDVEAKLELYFLWDSGTPAYRAVYGSCICTGKAVGADKDGIATVTYTFQGTAVLAWHSGAAEPTY